MPFQPFSFQTYLHFNKGKLGPAEGIQNLPVEFEFQAEQQVCSRETWGQGQAITHLFIVWYMYFF